jgi:hypothetical protein
MSNATEAEKPPVKPEVKSVFSTGVEAIAEANSRNSKIKKNEKTGKMPSGYKTYKISKGTEVRFVVGRSQGAAAALAAVEFGVSIELIGGKSTLDPATYLSLLDEDGTNELAELLAARGK